MTADSHYERGKRRRRVRLPWKNVAAIVLGFCALVLFFHEQVGLVRNYSYTSNTPFKGRDADGESISVEKGEVSKGAWDDTVDAESREYELLVLVIAGSNQGNERSDKYKWQIAVWINVIRAVARMGLPIRVYLMDMDPSIQKPRTAIPLTNGDGARDVVMIQIPGENTYIPGVLNMTVRSIEYIRDAKLPGHRHRFMLRTNLSSFWCFAKYLEYIRQKFPGTNATKIFDGITAENSFVSGAGFLLSHDLEDVLLADEKSLNFDEPDDVSIGGFFIRRHNIQPTRGHRLDLLYPTQSKVMSSRISTEHYHFRVKMGTDTDQDNFIMSYLFFMCYGEGFQE